MGRTGRRPTHENHYQASAGGRHTQVRRRVAAGCILRHRRPPQAGRRLLSLHGSGGEHAAAQGFIAVRRHSLLPHPLHLLQLRQPHHRQENGTAGTLSAGAGTGNCGHGQTSGAVRENYPHPLHRRRHPHDPLRPSDGAPAARHPGQFRSVPVRGIHRRGRPPGYAGFGEASSYPFRRR